MEHSHANPRHPARQPEDHPHRPAEGDSYLSHLECSRCGLRHEAGRPQQLCTSCGSPLLARYDLERARARLDRDEAASRPGGLWRYRELLPVRQPEHRITLGEGATPMLPVPRLASRLGLDQLWVKDEGQNPTGTFKARGAAVGIAMLRELGVGAVVLPTAGNAGGAWATYAARAGIRCSVYMPKDAPAANKAEVVLAGAELVEVEGLISDAGRLAAQRAKEHGWFDASTLKEPYRIEGKKTMGYEIAEAFGWALPDVVIYPTGGGVGLIGMWKAFQELWELGWLEGRPGIMPRMVAVQAEGCAPIVRAWEAGEPESHFWEGARTVAAGLRVPKALGDFLVLQSLRESGGTAVAVSDAEILEAARELAGLEGVVAAPEGAATLAACRRLRQSGWIGREDRVVLLNTGDGSKYLEALVAPERADRPESGQ